MEKDKKHPGYRDEASVTNSCKLCAPLGSSLVYKGIRGCVPLIHGSQGCATYIRRYVISHFKEPMDIASTNFTEESAIFGGRHNFITAVKNIINAYHPEVIGISSTCLSETIGDDVSVFIRNLFDELDMPADQLPEIINTSTPSYKGSHSEGFREAVLAVTRHFASPGNRHEGVNIMPGFVSPADIRYLKQITSDFGVKSIFVTDYSETLDNTVWDEYQKIPEGGTPVEELLKTGSSRATIEFGLPSRKMTGGSFLKEYLDVPLFQMPMPIGIRNTDRFVETLETLSGKEVPVKHNKARGRLIDAYIDGHKYVFGKKAVVYGDEDFCFGMVSFLEEIGIETLFCATDGNRGILENQIREIKPRKAIQVIEEGSYDQIDVLVGDLKPDLLIGNSKGYYISRKYEIPLVRLGFPIHDRVGGPRLQTLGYEGTQFMFDAIVNALLEYKQEHSPVGYKYL